jgi:diguanylate cyclase (GGDEF)-like protein/PAS domain S-box-containing protein
MTDFDPANLPNVLDLLLDAVCVVDTDGRFVFVSAASESIFGYTASEMIGQRVMDLVFHEDRAKTLAAVERIVAGQLQLHFENRYVRKDGSLVHLMWSARWSEADRLRVAVARDITARKHDEVMQAALYAISEAAHKAQDETALNERVQAILAPLSPAPGSDLARYAAAEIVAGTDRLRAQSLLHHMARHDPLTGLPNRALFHDRLNIALAHARRDQAQLAVLFLDLDRFKQINDRLGHAAGDLLLQEVAQRLKASLRESDTVGRIGGDEFLILLHHGQGPENARRVAEKIRVAVAQPYLLDGHTVSVVPSIGIARCPQQGEDGMLLIQRADDAMYGAKRAGGNRVMQSDELASDRSDPAAHHPAGSAPTPKASPPAPETPPAAVH